MISGKNQKQRKKELNFINQVFHLMFQIINMEFHSWNREQIWYILYKVLMKKILLGVYGRWGVHSFLQPVSYSPKCWCMVLYRFAHCGIRKNDVVGQHSRWTLSLGGLPNLSCHLRKLQVLQGSGSLKGRKAETLLGRGAGEVTSVPEYRNMGTRCAQ